MALAMLPHLEIVDRVKSQFPAVESVIGFANTRYTALKNYSELSKSTFDRAENTLQMVVNTVAPVVGRFEQPIHYADSMAVRGLDTLTSSIDSLTKTSTELKTTTVAAIDQTRARLNSMKNETLEKVHSVLTVPANVFPLINNIFAAGDYILDYVLPPPEGFKTTPPAEYPIEVTEGEQVSDFAVIFRALITRMKHFTERVHERLVVYSREKWFPGLLNSVGTFKGSVEAEAKKLLNGHGAAPPAKESPAPREAGSAPLEASPAPLEASPAPKVNGQQQQEKAQKQGKKAKKERKAEERGVASEVGVANGDAPLVSDEQQ